LDATVATLTIRQLDEELKRELRIRAARRGRSMEEEARQILRAALVRTESDEEDLYTFIRRFIDPIGGVDLELPPREPPREPPRFEE
jgi:antitoxin FitA